MQWRTWVIHERSLLHCRTRESPWIFLFPGCPLPSACVFQRTGYNEDDCGGEVTMGPVVSLPGINNKQHMEEWLYSPWSPKMDFWCRDAVSFSLCILAVLPLTVSHAPRIARHATDELKVCQLAGWEGRRERHQKEFIQWVFLTRILALSWVWEGLFRSSLRFSPSYLPWKVITFMSLLTWTLSPVILKLWPECGWPAVAKRLYASPSQQCFLDTRECVLKPVFVNKTRDNQSFWFVSIINVDILQSKLLQKCFIASMKCGLDQSFKVLRHPDCPGGGLFFFVS